ncbi:EamA-like transporter family protein [Litoreibacter ascidiaceicola]|uniref:EamA-like transporter family protein n=1 Tax=Litoreibacter ascidiaceicola TaxID=1486859 RepID=A0A1M4V649_9RHOB|nr:DMT family transporter [Litoreibacter ascidiaceicola]SHE64348.1 EamA-like transporter family protein [Litoreibacter ascidiaceicola]
MTPLVFFAVLTAALLHAVWNALVKGGADKRLNMAGVVIGHLPIAVPMLAFVPAPDPASYPYLFAGIALHFGYQCFLLESYRIGDLTQVYPIARGVAPLLVAVVSLVFLGVDLSSMEILAVVTIAAGILSISLVRGADGLRNGRATAMALATGCFIASYSLVDGLGARVAGTALGFYAWLGIANAVLFVVFMAVTTPQVLRDLPIKGKKIFFVGGSASFVAFSLVMWAFTQAPIALVTALREISIIFALLIGVLLMGERLSLGKVVSTMITLLGVILLRATRS